MIDVSFLTGLAFLSMKNKSVTNLISISSLLRLDDTSAADVGDKDDESSPR